jgi:3-oxoacyl-[acyl-carrier protein] reductase
MKPATNFDRRRPVTGSQHRTGIVTGSSRGIGRAIAERLARDGLAIVVNYQSGQTAVEETVAAIEKDGGVAIAFRADVSLCKTSLQHTRNISRVTAGGAARSSWRLHHQRLDVGAAPGNAGYGPYAMTKAAVEGLRLILAREMKGRDVTVNTIAPGGQPRQIFFFVARTPLLSIVSPISIRSVVSGNRTILLRSRPFQRDRDAGQTVRRCSLTAA